MRYLHHLTLSQETAQKLIDKHNVREAEVEEAFLNFEHGEDGYFKDLREDHKSDPPTLWFLSETHRGRLLKIIFIPKDGKIFIRSAYDPDGKEIALYQRKLMER